jgi:hypothetical protein
MAQGNLVCGNIFLDLFRLVLINLSPKKEIWYYRVNLDTFAFAYPFLTKNRLT